PPPLRASDPGPPPIPAPDPWNAMKPRIQCVLTPWIRGFTASGTLSAQPTPPPAPDPVERHETRDPVRPDAVDPGFHYALRPAPCVLRPAPSARRPASGSRPPRHHSAQSTRANPSASRTNAEPERKPSATP